jgi:hypothetical protein
VTFLLLPIPEALTCYQERCDATRLLGSGEPSSNPSYHTASDHPAQLDHTLITRLSHGWKLHF